MTWRFIKHSEHTAAENMAIDEAILDAHIAGLVPPTLRVYGFEPAAISLGYAQKLTESEESVIRNAGLDIVRRPTGGRAVLHLDELTYSFVGTSTDDDSGNGFLDPSVAKAYKQICDGLIQAIAQFGVAVTLGSSTADYRTSYDCFVATTSADLTYKGKKMAGSAQLRRKHGVLQHGSILLKQDQSKMAQVFGADLKVQEMSRHANLFDVLNRSVPMEQLEAAMKRGFSIAFDQDFVDQPLSPEEQKLVKELMPRYQSLDKIAG